MLKNYLSIGVRNLLKYKQVTLINLLGLTVSITAFLIIFLFVQYELSYDNYHEKSDRLFRVSREWLNQDKQSSLHLGHVAPPFGPLLKNDFPGIIKESVRFLNDKPVVSYKEKDISLVEDNFFFADEGVFNMFSWNLIEGDALNALSQPNGIILSESAAKRYFGSDDPLGKTLIYNDMAEFQVLGIMENVPANSHFHPELIASFHAVEIFFGKDQLMQNWGSNNYSTYVLLDKGINAEVLTERLPLFIDDHLGQILNQKASDFNILHLWPIRDIHLHSHLDSEIEPNGDILYIYIYSIIAVFILLIACINFINLATARSVTRSREVGVRKVMGALRRQLVSQFLTESVIIATIALVVAVLLVFSLLPEFNEFVNRALSIDFTDNIVLILAIAGLIITVGFIAGSYPALVLSAYQPVSILRATKLQSGKHPFLRATLVIFQFSISIALIIGVLTVTHQLNYLKNKPLGFEGTDLMILPANDEIYQNFENLRQQWLQKNAISSVSLASRVPSGRLLDSQDFQAEVNGEIKSADFRVADVHVDHDYLDILRVHFVAGRNFDRKLQSDSTEAFIINEATVSAMGWSSAEEAVEKEVIFGGGARRGRIIGVVEDFHFESLHQPISPMVFLITEGRARYVMVDINKSQYDTGLAYLTDQWSYLMPDIPFEIFSISDSFDEQYDNEKRLSQVVSFFAILAIIIAMLGLIGLASFTTEQRYKEIGIRKVLGASVSQIMVLISKRFTLLVLIAMIIASPVAYYLMSLWITSFAYHEKIPWWSFPVSGVLALLLAWATISSQTFSAANRNPVSILKDQ